MTKFKKLFERADAQTASNQEVKSAKRAIVHTHSSPDVIFDLLIKAGETDIKKGDKRVIISAGDMEKINKLISKHKDVYKIDWSK